MPERLVLPAKLDLPAAADILHAFRAARGADVMVDASAVKHLGTNGLQVLLSARDTWKSDGKRFGFAAVSDAFNRDLDQFGLSPEILAAGVSAP